jgi:NADH-quinone oxidoreductase subunit M
MSFLLPILVLLPLLAAAAILLAPAAMAKTIALGFSVVELALALLLLGVGFGGTVGDWTPAMLEVREIGFGVSLGLDPISYWLVLLTAFLMPLVVLSSYASDIPRAKGYYFWLVALVTPMVGTFVAQDALLFYVFFELTLVPMYFLIGIWGGEDRSYAAKKFFLYTFVGGVFTLAALLYVGINAGSFDLDAMARWSQANVTSGTAKVLLFTALAAGFAVKVPLFPVHTWLPLAHTVAPTAGSVILAGVLLKLGTYGLLKVVLPIGLLSTGGLLPVIADVVVPVVAVLCIVGIIYGALIAWVQEDVKKLVAYSSVSHLGFCVLGLVALNDQGMQGSVFYMINHGISTGALFLLIGMIYDRFHTRQFADYSGLGTAMPIFSFFLVLFTMSSIGLPGTNGFVSEFLTILGAFTSPYLGPIFGIFAALGVVLGAIYMLHMVARLVFGPLKLPETHHHDASQPEAATSKVVSHDLNGREVMILTPLAVLVIVLGVFPTPLLKSIQPSVQLARTPVATATLPVADALDVEEMLVTRHDREGERSPQAMSAAVVVTGDGLRP